MSFQTKPVTVIERPSDDDLDRIKRLMDALATQAKLANIDGDQFLQIARGASYA